jgi:hypothetical protein
VTLRSFTPLPRWPRWARLYHPGVQVLNYDFCAGVWQVQRPSEVSRERWHENAHTRRLRPNAQDIIVRGRPVFSGRLERCIAIGEWRDRAYRVRRDVLDAWSGLSVKDGYIQRSAVPPTFVAADRFYAWFLAQRRTMTARNV